MTRPRRISLKTKFIVFFAGFTLFILTSVSIYFYLSECNFLEEQSRTEISFYLRLFDESIEKQLQNSVYELAGLKNQILPYLTRKFYHRSSKSELIILLEKFATGYPYKFTRLQLLDTDLKPAVEVTPVKVFGGKIEPRIRIQGISNLNEKWRRQLLKNPKNSSTRIFGPESGAGGHVLYIFLPIQSSSFSYLAASIQLDFLLDQALDQVNLPPTFAPIVADSAGVILLANEEQLMNRLMNRVFPNIDLCSNEWIIPDKNRIARGKLIKTANVFILLQKNIHHELNQLHSRMFQMIIFAVVFLTLSSLLVWYIARRMTATLHKITNVAIQVAEGDFSQKIEMNRNDELGILISTFNEMVVHLDTSYKSLNLVNEELKQKIEELKRARIELSQKQRLAVVGEAISKISHEIQNKIGGVNIWVQNLALYKQDDPTIELYIQEMQTALKSFMEMLVNFKKFYREPQLNKSDVNLQTSIQSILNRYAPDIRAKQLTIETCFNSAPETISADRELLEQALINLLLNAIYFSPNEGVIKIVLSAGNRQLKIAVSDQGKGIGEDALDKIFQPFFTTKSSGSGLGLAIVNNIIKAHRGRVSCGNTDEGGARFEICLPGGGWME